MTCEACRQRMDGGGCTETRAYAWGQEPIWRGELRDAGPVTRPCHDCDPFTGPGQGTMGTRA